MLMDCKVLTRVDYTRLKKVCQSFRDVGGSFAKSAALLEEELGRAVRVPGERVSPDLVTMNARVRIRNIQTRRTLDVTVVYPIDADPLRGRASVFSPLGRALLGARMGGIVDVHASAGTVSYRIEGMLYQPEARSAGTDGRPDRLFHSTVP